MGGSKRAAAMSAWVKGFIVIGVGVLALAVIAVFFGHGPWQHM